jgi:hypothetical protein
LKPQQLVHSALSDSHMAGVQVSGGASGGGISAKAGIATSVRTPNPTAKRIRIGKPSITKHTADPLDCQVGGTAIPARSPHA